MPIEFFAEWNLHDCSEFSHILKQYPDLNWIEDYQEFRKHTMHREKQCVIFARKRGAWLKPFHCYHQNHESLYFSLDIAEGCRFDCVYCYLQSYLNNGALVIFVNRDGLENELRSFASTPVWISTGILTDSLLAEEHHPMIAWLSHRLPEQATLELRTKSANVEILNDQNISREKLVVAWSLSPETVVTNYEYGTSTLTQRIDAAKRALELGYRIAFHFDPVFHFEGWKQAYGKLFNNLKEFKSERVAFLSIGLFRYMPDLGSIIRKRFPYHQILTEEFFPDQDGKYHYLRSIRKEMYAQFKEWLSSWNIQILWSMEPEDKLIENYRSFSSALLPSDF
jgi:spore photoproduct lyase